MNTSRCQCSAIIILRINESLLYIYLVWTFFRRRSAGNSGFRKPSHLASGNAHGPAEPDNLHPSRGDPPPYAALAHAKILRCLRNRDQAGQSRRHRRDMSFVITIDTRGLSVSAGRSGATWTDVDRGNGP